MILRLCAVAIALAVCALLLRELGFRGAPVFAVLCFLFLLGLLTDNTSRFGDFGRLLSRFESVTDGAEAIFKIVGVGYVAGICSDICSDIGEKTIAKGVLVAGRVEIFAIALPFVLKIFDSSLELLG